MNVLVTGAGGFIGGHVARTLAQRGHSVVAVINRHLPPELSDIAGIEVIRADLASGSPLEFKPTCEAIVHCAAALPSRVADEAELYRQNVEGTRQLLAFASAADAQTVIYCSSMAAFGAIDADIVTPELAPSNPGSYGRSKLEGEHLLAAYAACRGARTLSVRLPGVVGRGSHDNFLSNLAAAIHRGQPFVARNPEALFNNIVHIDDLSGFFADLLETLPLGHRVATIAAEAPMKVSAVIGQLCAAAPADVKVSYEVGGKPFLISPEPARKLGYRVPSVSDSITRLARDWFSTAHSKIVEP